MKTELDKKIEKETTFLFNGIQFGFRLDDYTREFGYLLARFHVITDIEIVSDLLARFHVITDIEIVSDLVMKVFSQYRMKRLPRDFADCYTGRAGEIPAFN